MNHRSEEAVGIPRAFAHARGHTPTASETQFVKQETKNQSPYICVWTAPKLPNLSPSRLLGRIEARPIELREHGGIGRYVRSEAATDLRRSPLPGGAVSTGRLLKEGVLQRSHRPRLLSIRRQGDAGLEVDNPAPLQVMHGRANGSVLPSFHEPYR